MGFDGGQFWRSINADDDSLKLRRISWQLVKRIFTFAKPYKKSILLMLIAISLTTALSLVAPLLIRQIIDVSLPNGNRNEFFLYASLLLVIPFIIFILQVIKRYINSIVGEGVIYDLRVALYTHLQKLSLRFYTRTKQGEIISRLNNDVVNAQDAISNTIVDTISNILQIVATLGIMLWIDWRITLIGVAIFPVLMFMVRKSAIQLRRLTYLSHQYNANMNGRLNETTSVSGMLLARLFNRTVSENSLFAEDAGKVRNIGIKRTLASVRIFALITQLSAILTGLVFLLGGIFVLGETLTIGVLVAFTIYLAYLYAPMQALAGVPVTFSVSVSSFERMFEVLDLQPDIVQKKGAKKLTNPQGNVEFENVSFDYETIQDGVLINYDRAEAVVEHIENKDMSDDKLNSSKELEKQQVNRDIALKNINFTAKPNELLAIVGPSGAGKTSITYLILRLYDVVSGSVKIDGIDVKDYITESLFEHIGVFTQETYLFHDTILNNIAYGSQKTTYNDVVRVAKAANLHDFVMSLPAKYNTMVGERGYRLSGGEKQRVGIARVLLKNPKILILDEATSHLDTVSERLIQKSLNELMKNRTTVAIAHRLSTVISADKILVMENGNLVAQGKHHELLQKSELYQKLHAEQFEKSNKKVKV